MQDHALVGIAYRIENMLARILDIVHMRNVLFFFLITSASFIRALFLSDCSCPGRGVGAF